MACTVVATPRRLRMRRRWFSTVRSDRPRVAAISVCRRPAAVHASTSRSRSDRGRAPRAGAVPATCAPCGTRFGRSAPASAGPAARHRPEEGPVRLQDVARHRTVPHVGFSIDRRACAEPASLGPVDALHRIVPSARGREQHETVVPQWCTDRTHRVSWTAARLWAPSMTRAPWNAACAIVVLISGRDFLEQGFGRELAKRIASQRAVAGDQMAVPVHGTRDAVVDDLETQGLEPLAELPG